MAQPRFTRNQVVEILFDDSDESEDGSDPDRFDSGEEDQILDGIDPFEDLNQETTEQQSTSGPRPLALFDTAPLLLLLQPTDLGLLLQPADPLFVLYPAPPALPQSHQDHLQPLP
ncbi:uncharacterized protein LOC127639814 isoform X2 [Xyrauchen texanus]|uniref:uncharacterized protein LOC127639814 isoform X2 n=1 Tax=Xyrauchen texanus TaxID=154827 RepID=UPI00224192C1|nr:uncharacterized protein LOC127639814 isoform X2 [Xyrauchen texanus]